MNKLRSGRPWLTVMNILGEQAQSLLINFLCINNKLFRLFLTDRLKIAPGSIKKRTLSAVKLSA